ncbi:MAG: hypothetical protein U9N14_08090, partial [Pseudomonadota bacterium]|nr:hypothetical protein [Pseudomonadota bacterium]
MKHESKQDIISEIASESLECIEHVARDAEQSLREHKPIGASALAAVNTLTDTKQVSNLISISDKNRRDFEELSKQPVIARINYT